MKKSEISLRKPNASDIERMFEMLEKSLSQYLIINRNSSKNNQLVIDKGFVEDYVNNGKYLCLIAEIDSEIVGWLAGSQNKKVLSEHVCSSDEFYIEEIVVDFLYRSRGIGSFLLRNIPLDNLKAIVTDTLKINDKAITFYEHSGFSEVLGMSEEFSKNWVRMSKEV